MNLAITMKRSTDLQSPFCAPLLHVTNPFSSRFLTPCPPYTFGKMAGTVIFLSLHPASLAHNNRRGLRKLSIKGA